MASQLRRLWVEEEGQTLVEYSLIIALISVTVIAAIGLVAGRVQTKYSNIHDAI